MGNTPTSRPATPTSAPVFPNGVVSVIHGGGGVGVRGRPVGVAVTPDGKHAYVTSFISNTVSVIDTTSNTVVATVPVGSPSEGIAITPDGKHVYVTGANVSVVATASNTVVRIAREGIKPVTKAVKLQIGTFTVTIPPGSFKKHEDGSFIFEGVIHGVSLEARIKPAGTLRYAFHAEAEGANLTGTKNTVYVTDDSGATSVTAEISH